MACSLLSWVGKKGGGKLKRKGIAACAVILLLCTGAATACAEKKQSGQEVQRVEEQQGMEEQRGKEKETNVLMETEKEDAVSDTDAGSNAAQEAVNRFPAELAEIPEVYYRPASEQGTLVNLYYDTYESMTYSQKSKPLNKRAVVYLPYGYSEEEQYNVFYLMHGGWSNETAYLGVPGRESVFKNILDHGIEDGMIRPMIVVCPTYNNESESDSGDYRLALRLTENYHNELVNDLIPAVEGQYSTYAENVTADGIKASRDHRAFAGFSMGSVATWRTFEYCLDYFRYFFPESGSLTTDEKRMAAMVEDSGHEWNDFFIYAASGTDDFAYSSFRQQIDNMIAEGETFRFADNETEGNIYYLEKEGGIHNYEYAHLYLYNGLCWIWDETETDRETGNPMESNTEKIGMFAMDSTVADVINDPVFEGFGRLLFPVDRSVDTSMTLEEISNSGVYVWYSNIRPEKTVEILNELKREAAEGTPVFYSIYTEEEMEEDASKKDTGLFLFRGKPGAEFAVMNAGGGFMYVGAMHDSFPHALEVSQQGYHSFALIYRPDRAYEDLAKAICFIYDNADALQVNPEGYSLWGGSAGARMAATLGNESYLKQFTGREDIPQAAAVIMQYTGYTDVSPDDAPTYVCVGTRDGIADWRTMQGRLDKLEALGIPTEFHSYDGLGHGFGIGTGTVAEGWVSDAIAFWENQMEE